MAAARRDRAGIIDRIRTDNRSAAMRMDQRFSDAAARLASLPMLGRPGKIPGTRELIPHESYRLVYEVQDGAVWILAVVHTARQWPPTTE